MKPLYNSQIDIKELVLYVVLYLLFFVYPMWMLVEGHLLKYIFLGSVPLFCYGLWCFFINIYYFFKDKIKIVYLFRVVNREKEIQYSDLKEIKYIHIESVKLPHHSI